MTVPFCRDCRHFWARAEVCLRPTGGVQVSPGDGEPKYYGTSAAGERSGGLIGLIGRLLGRCGPEGKHFEQRRPRPPQPTGDDL